MKMIKSVFFLNINLLVGIVLIHTGCKENDKSTSPKVPTYNMPQSNEPTKPTKPKKPRPSVEWSYIPSGSFIMGSSIYEANRLPDENQHQVILSAFKMSKNEVTFEQYDAFCEATRREKPSDEGWGRGRLPVINVSWNDARAFASWMGCRLPTQAEWEYACRAGTTTPFYTGYNITTSQANFNGKQPYIGNTSGIFRKKTTEVGSFAPNPWGLYDMHGNVWEWCSDWYGELPTETQTNPKGPVNGRYRVYCGGGWRSDADRCRSAIRDSNGPEYLYYIGIRLVSLN